ncbi:hypothetical protein OD91_1308 [Lutibacter sp. Hel_I_33_5]|nr:hypothetical protein OD91_1308 [Lutibacter sp. Hel_I_33_5]
MNAVFILSIIISCSKNDENTGGGNCSEECVYTITANETAGTAASSLDGVHNLTMHHADAASPYPDGTKAKFTIANNVLTVEIDGKCITIKNPILTVAGSTEVKFKDSCRDKISYDVSENKGSLNEVNISDLNGKWLGQFNDR